MKKAITTASFFLAIFVVFMVGSNAASAKSHFKYYPVKLKVVKTDDTDWVVKGKTKAPDGTKVVGITKEDDTSLLEDSDINIPTVKNGRFKASLDGIALIPDEAKAGKKVHFYVAATTNKKPLKDTVTVKHKYLKKIRKSKYKQTLPIKKSQISAINSLTEDKQKPKKSKPKKKKISKNVQMNKQIDMQLKQYQGLLDDDGNPVPDGTPEEEFAFSFLISKIHYIKKDDEVEVHFTSGYNQLSKSDRKELGHMTIRLIRGILGEVDEDEDPEMLHFMFFNNQNHYLGRSKVFDPLQTTLK